LLRGFAANTAIHLGPGTFETEGFYEGIGGSNGWQAKTGMNLIGSGIDVTTLKRANSSVASKHLYAAGHELSSGGQPNLADYFEVRDLTIDCNFAGQSSGIGG
jgi:hypothetical protein